MKMKPCTRCGKNTVHTCFSCSNALCSKCSEIDLLCKDCRAKMPPKRHESDVARLLEMIDLKYQAAHHGLSGVAQGTAKHDFINQRVENMERMRQRVIDLVGEDEANRLVCEQLDQSGQEKPRGGTE